MAIGRVVPWTSWEEWGAVYRDLFADSVPQKNAALYQLAVWRCRGKVPLAIEITGSLVEVNIRDQHSRDSGGASDDLIRLQYSMAVVRMVNGISDKAQKGKTATSVSSNAAAAGLPRVLVDVRHEASHNDMPSLAVLRLAAAQALEWLSAAYWQRQEAHLQQQKSKVVQLLQEFVTLKCTSAGGQPKPEFSQQANGRGINPLRGSPLSPGDSRYASSLNNEEMHEQQAVLNQLKEVPIKSMSASLLVAPLLDYGIMNGCVPKLAFSEDDPTKQEPDPVFQSIIQSLSRQWPSLPALLLNGVIQRLCNLGQQQPRTDAHLVLAGWVKLLLESPSRETGQQRSLSVARTGKRKSIGSESKAQPSQDTSGYRPTAPQLRACIGACLAAMPTSSGQATAAVRKVLTQLLQHLQHHHPGEYSTWGDTARVLAASCHPHGAQEAPMLMTAMGLKPSVDQWSSAQQRQQSLLQDLNTTPDAAKDRLSQGWELQANWTPCAIGALPDAFDPNGCQPLFPPAQPSPSGAATSHEAASNPQPSAMVFALRSSNPSCHAQELAKDLAVPEEVSLQLGVVSGMHSGQASTDQFLHSDYWKRFQDHDSGAADFLETMPECEALNNGPLRKAIKAL